MKAEISNLGLHRERHFTGVYLQQGRMLVDRDWNELCEILRHLGTAVVSEAIGTGVPRHDGLLWSPTPGKPVLALRAEGGRVAATGVIGQALRRDPAAKISLYQNQYDLPDTLRNLSPPQQQTTIVATRSVAAAAPAPKTKAAATRKAASARTSKTALDVTLGQEVNPGKPLPNTPQPLQNTSPDQRLLYVDIWDRVVTAFETDQGISGDLIDPALHGADSCFRKQRMVQIKAASLDDLAKLDDPCLRAFLPDRIPPKGDAVFTADLTQAGEGGDPCDPCAEQVTIARSVTNHLFRLEVHSVEYDPTTREPTQLVLKWSQDNGARELRPADFATMGDPMKHSYEYFSDATERLLGMRSDDWVAEEFLRGVLDPADFEQASAILPRIREWDGWCRLQGGPKAWAVAGGRDAGGVIGKGASIAAGVLQVQVAAGGFQFSLTLDGRRFLPGDYWLALVRTRAPEAQRVRVISPTPVGIGHHYCILGVATVKDPELRFEQLSPYDLRRLQHPSLTCLDATDIAFAKPCNTSIYSQPAANNIQNVADALKLLCSVTAEQIGFAADCGYLKGANTDTVKKALEALCIQPANTIPYTAGCDYLKQQKVEDVAAALNALCGQPASAIPYTPACDYLKQQQVSDVAAALEALCKRGAEKTLPVVKTTTWQNDVPMKLSVFMQGLQVTFSEELLATPAPSTDSFIVTWEIPYDLLQRMDLGVDDFLTPQIVAGDVKNIGSGLLFTPRQKITTANFTKLQSLVDAKKYDFGPGVRCRVRLLGRALLAKKDGRPVDGFVPMKPSGNTFVFDLANSGLGQPSDFESWFYVVEG